jgi:hypothetical protein
MLQIYIGRKVDDMKMRVTRDDLAQLTAYQKQRLTELWIPEKYDVAVANICKDIANDEYDEIEFVVGDIAIVHGTHIYLTDLRAVPDNSGSDTDNDKYDNQTNNGLTLDSTIFGQAGEDMSAPFEDVYGEEDYEDYAELDDEDDEYVELNYERPTTFSKEDCTPLLNIGQMIDILQRNNFGKYDFYLTASTYEIGCELGKNGARWEDDGENTPAELCDVLWESVKAIL